MDHPDYTHQLKVCRRGFFADFLGRSDNLYWVLATADLF